MVDIHLQPPTRRLRETSETIKKITPKVSVIHTPPIDRPPISPLPARQPSIHIQSCPPDPLIVMVEGSLTSKVTVGEDARPGSARGIVHMFNSI